MGLTVQDGGNGMSTAQGGDNMTMLRRDNTQCPAHGEMIVLIGELRRDVEDLTNRITEIKVIFNRLTVVAYILAGALVGSGGIQLQALLRAVAPVASAATGTPPIAP